MSVSDDEVLAAFRADVQRVRDYDGTVTALREKVEAARTALDRALAELHDFTWKPSDTTNLAELVLREVEA